MIMANNPRKESTQITMRVGRSQKQEWAKKARAAGMSLTLYICYVVDRAELKVTVSLGASDSGPPPRR